MATTGVGFRWLDILEKEFDKACVELDTSLTDLDTEEPDVVYGARQKITTLSSCFAQLTHKALTIFQNSAKLEAELVDMRAELVQARAASVGGVQDSGDAAGMVPEAARARAEAAQLARENAALRETVLALHSELFGARLATKYLDKELAGRIQQLQLLGRDMRAELRDSLWAQVEAEILLQRHKTLVRVCRGLSPRPARPALAAERLAHGPSAHAGSHPRTVRVRRSPHLGLGISVTGGREHGVPILISELEAGGPAALTGELYVGDAILAINDVDLTQACHKEAVQALQSVKGDCALRVHFIATDDDDRLSEDNYRFPLYPDEGEAFGAEPDGSGATPTAPRTPDYNRGPSEVASGSGSECSEAPARYAEPPLRYTEPPIRYTEPPIRYADPPLRYAEPPLRYIEPALRYTEPLAVAPYPDYNSINNNLSILDMDDDSIKIEARLEVVRLESPEGSPGVGRRHRGPYRGLPADSSAESPHSTPVHAPPAARAPAAPPAPARRAPLKKKRKPHDWRSKGAYRPVHVAPDGQSSDEPAQDRPVDAACGGPTVPAPPAPPAPPPPQELYVPPLVTIDPDKSKPNGDSKRRENKGFRIGSARRVTEDAPLASLPPLTNGDVERGKPLARLLAGEGDPDFGTPV